MRYRNRNRNPAGRLGGIVFLAIFFIALFTGHFLPVLMIALAFSSLISSFSSPRGLYGGLQGFVWFLGLALCFTIGFWPWIMLPVIISALLGMLARPIIAALLGLGIFSVLNRNQAPQPMYTPPVQPYQPPPQPYYQPPSQTYQPYGEGYQPSQEQPPAYQEGESQYQPYRSTPTPLYEQPQSQYPQQELPPQQ